ncbi:MAG: NADH-quinone oxidoreductase subunit M [Bacteroidetes bacterium]|nr:NADH-quinone oxidoreductase subunit M [Bacteroidota bacterium]
MDKLSLLILIPLFTALLMLFAKDKLLIKRIALAGAVLQMFYSILLIVSFINSERSSQFLFVKSISWYKTLNIDFISGIDGISVSMILLTSIVVLAGVLVSWDINERVKDYFLLLSLLSIGAYGFFISLDLFVMFFFLELAVIPKYLLIAIWGSGKKEYSAMKLALLLMTGSALILIGILLIYFRCETQTFNIVKLAEVGIPVELQRISFPLIFTGFGIFTALFPFHTWVPDGHSSAPTAASMFLAGISMKLGGYGCLRAAAYLMPQATVEYSKIIVLLSVIAIFYGAFATLMQKDLKYMNAYSSVSHCGFILLGIGMLNHTSINGAVIQMISHGLMTALFFASIGMIYKRTHTRKIDELGGIIKSMPFIGSTFIIAGLCSLGLPGFSGFVAEMTIFIGAWQNEGMFYKVSTIIACASIVITAVYILRASAKAITGKVAKEEFENLKDADFNEKSASVLLIIAILLIGFTPFLLINLINQDTFIISENFFKIITSK